MPLEPFGDFLAAVAHLAERDAGADGRAAREYLDAFSKRREIVAQSSGKYELLGHLANAIREAHGALVFTETVRAANHAINRLDPLVSIDLITGSTARRQRREILDDLRVRRLDAVAAPRVLDEGVDVPDANLGIVMSASRTRRQMIQRMGRILRRKQPGVAARFVIMFAKDTVEDPTNRIERDGFLDEIERISEATGVFDSEQSEALDTFLAAPGPQVVPEPEHLERYERAAAAAGGEPGQGFESLGDVLADEMGVEAAYAFLSFTQGDRADPRRETAIRKLDARLPRPEPDAPYLEVELAALPRDRQAEGQAQAAVDRTGAARDRAHRVGVADQLHRVRRVLTARPVPVAGPRPERGLPLRVKFHTSYSCVDESSSAIDSCRRSSESLQPWSWSARRASVANTPWSTVNAVAAPRSRSENSTTVSRSSGSGSSQRNVYTSRRSASTSRNSPARKKRSPSGGCISMR